MKKKEGPLDPYLTEVELAARWGLNALTMRNRRLRNPQLVPTFFVFGKPKVRYLLSSIIEFESNTKNKQP